MPEAAKKSVKKATTRVAAAKAKAAEKAKKAKDRKVVRSVNSSANGFIEFIRERGVVGIAIGLAIGTVSSGTLKTIVEGFVTPLVNLLVGTQDKLESQKWHVNIGGREADFLWGSALSALITLLATIFVIYVIVRFAKLDKIDKKKD